MKKESLNRRQVIAGLAAGAGAIGFNRLASAQGDPSQYITQTASFGIGEGKEAEAVAAVEELVAAVEKAEPGVLAYIAHRPSDGSSKLFFFEIYENEAALAAHGQQPHLAKMGQAFQAGVFTGPVDIVKMDRIAGFSR